MTTTIFVETTFEAAHHLDRLPAEHKCRRPHGHSYRLRVEVTGELDPTLGWVMDYAMLKEGIRVLVLDVLDHRYLNAIEGIGDVSTAERVAGWIAARLRTWVRLPLGLAVELRETATCGVRVVG